MAVTPDAQRFARRAGGDVGEGIADLSLLGVPGLISFAGGFPDPLTFRASARRRCSPEFAASGETTAFQYAPTRGLAGPLDAGLAARGHAGT